MEVADFILDVKNLDRRIKETIDINSNILKDKHELLLKEQKYSY